MKNCIINFEDKDVLDVLDSLGFNCIPVIPSNKVSRPISAHADVLYNKVDNNTILMSTCQSQNLPYFSEYNIITVKNLQPGYTTECLLNFIVNDKYVIRNPRTSIELTSDREEIVVNQGYTRCSCLCINENAYITGDIGIYNRLIHHNLDCLLIDDSNIKLNGYDHGFIGGASLKLNDNDILFFGDFTDKYEKQLVINFIENHNMSCQFIKDKELVDIGSAIIF